VALAICASTVDTEAAFKSFTYQSETAYQLPGTAASSDTNAISNGTGMQTDSDKKDTSYAAVAHQTSSFHIIDTITLWASGTSNGDTTKVTGTR
jgi:hypothetical protein